jgi:hypothetical protein
MKLHKQSWKMLSVLAAVTLTFVGAITADAAPTPTLSMNGQVVLRPLTPTETATYSLTNVQVCAGISNVALGEPVYLDALVSYGVTSSNIVGVVWSITNKPPGSLAVATNSPLGTNVPMFNAYDRYNQAGVPVSLLAGRTFFRPDVSGTYTVLATITTTGTTHGTNIVPAVTNIVRTITAGTYYGAQVCAACHSGGFTGVPSVYPTWTNTPHASMFTRSIDGLNGYYSKSCISCHLVGYDTLNTNWNAGFYNYATLLNWQFPSVLTNGNWASMNPQLQHLANIQCENCHGPGSQHLGSGGSTNAITVSYNAGDCSQCHDALSHHYYSAEWNNSLHATPTRTPSGANRPACVRCHTAPGFANYIANIGNTNGYGTNTVYEAISCQACHDPHDDSNPHQLRVGTSVLLADGVTTVTNAGAGTICMVCHRSRNGSVTNSIVKYPLLQQTWEGGSSFGPHDNPASDMLEGVNGWTYGKAIPNSPHANVVSDTCVGCHYQPIASTDPAFTLAGGHSTEMSYIDTNGNQVDVTYACTSCHGKLTTFDFPVADYNGDGIIEGVQTEVQHLLDKLSTLLPPTNYYTDATKYQGDGKVKTGISTQTNWPAKYLQAGYNWQFVNNDESHGVHNAAYAVGLLKASIGDLIGDSNGDTLPDSWQISYFGAGFATNAAAAPNAINNTNGIPNWMMCALGMNPFSGSKTVNGAVYINNGNVINGTSNIVIYTAAEVVFNTEVSKTYTIQGVTAITGTWQNVSTNIPGTGTSISYLTPTRGNQQMFYRVVSTP